MFKTSTILGSEHLKRNKMFPSLKEFTVYWERQVHKQMILIQKGSGRTRTVGLLQLNHDVLNSTM